MKSCADTALLLSESMVRELPLLTRLGLRLHLLLCGLCRRNSRQTEAMQHAFRKLSDQSGPGGLSAEAKSGIKDALRREG